MVETHGSGGGTGSRTSSASASGSSSRRHGSRDRGVTDGIHADAGRVVGRAGADDLKGGPVDAADGVLRERERTATIVSGAEAAQSNSPERTLTPKVRVVLTPMSQVQVASVSEEACPRKRVS